MHVVAHRLHLEGAARRQLAGQRLRPALGELAGREQPAVGDAGAGVLQVDEAAHLGLQLAADLVQQGGEGAVARGLRHRPGEAVGGELDQVGFEGVHGVPIPGGAGRPGTQDERCIRQSGSEGPRQTRPSTPEDAGRVTLDLGEQVGDVRRGRTVLVAMEAPVAVSRQKSTHAPLLAL